MALAAEVGIDDAVVVLDTPPVLAISPATKPGPHRFQKGQSGNPLGRPRGTAGLAALIKQQTGDGKELVAFALKTLRSRGTDPKYRLQALEWLADRGWGKAIQSHEVTGQDGGAVVFTLRLGERDADRDD